MLLGQFRESFNIISVLISIFPSNITICVRFKISARTNKGFPLRSSLVLESGVSGFILASAIGFKVKDLINLIGLASHSVFNGNRTVSSRCRKRRCYHGANHSNCQQRSHEFFHCFFHGKSPFLFCPLPPPVFLYRGGGRGVVLFGLSRKLCAGRAGAQPRASGREVQFSHLPSLRVCACDG